MEKDEWIVMINKGDKESFRRFYNAYSESAIRIDSAITTIEKWPKMLYRRLSYAFIKCNRTSRRLLTPRHKRQ